MTTLTKKQIAEIADQLDCGFSCHINKKNLDFIFVPDSDKHPDMELDAWKNDLKKLRKNPDNYITIAPPQSRDSFRIMSLFIETLPDDNILKDRLNRALEKTHPFREFKFAIDNAGDFRQKWFDFKSEKLQEWVENELTFIGDEEE